MAVSQTLYLEGFGSLQLEGFGLPENNFCVFVTLAIDPPNTSSHTALIGDMPPHAPSSLQRYVRPLVAPPCDGTLVPSGDASPSRPSGSQSQVPSPTTDAVVIVNAASTNDLQSETNDALAKKKRRVITDI